MSEQDPATGAWHLDRRVPLALILTIIVQTGGIAMWAGSISSRLERVERDQIDATAARSGMDSRMRAAERDAGRIDERLINMDRRLGGIGTKLDKLLAQGRDAG